MWYIRQISEMPSFIKIMVPIINLALQEKNFIQLCVLTTLPMTIITCCNTFLTTKSKLVKLVYV